MSEFSRRPRRPRKAGTPGTPGTARPQGRPNPRRLAWQVLHDVAANDAYANLLLPGALAKAGVSGPEAALATELTYGTLRGLGLYDAVIAHAASRPVARIDIRALAAMRLGTHQILGMRTADHAAVSETVALVKKVQPRAAGFTNAVLRRVSERSREEWIALLTADADEAHTLEVRTSHPAWTVRALREALAAHGRDPEDIEALLAADNTPARVCVTALPGVADRDSIAQEFGTPTPLSPYGVHLDGGNPLAVPAVREGTARVQDEGSQLVALALAEAPLGTPGDPASAADLRGLPWFDMCAGPGGKTSVLAARARETGGGVQVVATDASAHRAHLVEDSTRVFVDAVEVHAADGREFGHAHPGAFARVLVDVPCSGLGALRRRPEARWRRKPSDVTDLAPVQRALLASAWDSLAVGGVLAYTTCSPHAEETLGVIREAVDRLGGLEVLDAPAVLAGITGTDAARFASAEVAGGTCVQLWPDRHDTDGMFLALLRKVH